ncbi:MAG: hypothetical protein RMK57_10260 [Bryobacterales bacterium]|nr:hypothetical protein [Bryobacteraceae bacterium]MDW8354898.1 hypothetical protein [Bryobacterales bacterium]
MPSPQCPLCESRRPRRFCPGVHREICTLCCGTEREVTIECPLDCPHLVEAHAHERLAPLGPEQQPHADVEVTEAFLERNSALAEAVGGLLASAAIETPGAADPELRAALEALVRTYRTRHSGLVYDTRPAHPAALGIYERVLRTLEELLRRAEREAGFAVARDADVLGVLVFWHRLAVANDNGRKRGRHFMGKLADRYAPAARRSAPRVIMAK